MKRIALLGSTGSIGTSTLEVIAAHPERLRLYAASTHRRWELLAEQMRTAAAAGQAPEIVVISDPTCREAIPADAFPSGTRLLFGPEAIEQIAADPAVDCVVSAIVGAAGLRGTWAAVNAGKQVALANKETLVVAGPLVMERARQTGAELLPVDSEHNALFQALHCGRSHEVRKLILTASGGPFRGRTAAQLQTVTVEQALSHPTWNMGPKITVDSATLMNKALEVIEARWLFGIEPDRIEVVVHPQSIVHSMVEFVDGSVLAQLSPPDMKLPIQYALSYPERWPGITPRMDWTQASQLTFQPPDREAFPALELGFEVARRGGTCGAVLNAANEAAVQRFLDGTLRFVEIPIACRAVLNAHQFDSQPTLAQLWEQDAWARREIQQWK